MNISTEIISELNPCKGRINNYLQYYKDFNGTLSEFIALDKISYDDKVWVFCRLASEAQLQKWTILCAESVLDIYESKYPNDFRPRNAISAAKDYLNGKITKDELKDAPSSAPAFFATAYAVYTFCASAYAAYAATFASDAAYAAANYAAAASYAAAATFTANSAHYAASLAADAARYAHSSAAYAARAAAEAAREIQENKNLQFMLKEQI